MLSHGLIPAILLILLSISACSRTGSAAAPNGDAPTPRPVTTVSVVEEPFVRAIRIAGTLAAEDQVALGFKVAGRVGEVRVDLGSVVRQGQIVAALVPTDFELRVRQAEAALTQARVRLGLTAEGDEDAVVPEETALVRQRRATVEEARLNLERMQTMVERGLSPRAALEAAQVAREVADGQYHDALEEIRSRQGMLAQRRSELELARQQLEDTMLRSPIDGAVRERRVTAGEYLAPGTPVLTIVRTDPLRLQLAIPERETPNLRVGLPVRVRVDGDTQTHAGRLARIGAAIDETNRTLPVEAVVPNTAGALRPGQFASAEIIISEDDPAVVIPHDTIVTFAGVQKVLTVEEGHASERRIRTGRRDADRVEVVEGLHAGDLVIRNPGDLVDGMPVSVRGAE